MPWIVDAGFERWPLIRRSRHDPQARAYYLVFAPAGTELAELTGAAGLSWTIEEGFQHAKDELGLHHCQALLAWQALSLDAVCGCCCFPDQAFCSATVGHRI